MKEEKENMKKIQKENDKKDKEEDIFSLEEITIEELAIDGICGVY